MGTFEYKFRSISKNYINNLEKICWFVPENVSVLENISCNPLIWLVGGEGGQKGGDKI